MFIFFLFYIQPYLDDDEHTLSPILSALVGQGGNLATSLMQRYCQIRVQSRKLDVGKRTE